MKTSTLLPGIPALPLSYVSNYYFSGDEERKLRPLGDDKRTELKNELFKWLRKDYTFFVFEKTKALSEYVDWLGDVIDDRFCGIAKISWVYGKQDYYSITELLNRLGLEYTGLFGHRGLCKRAEQERLSVEDCFILMIDGNQFYADDQYSEDRFDDIKQKLSEHGITLDLLIPDKNDIIYFDESWHWREASAKVRVLPDGSMIGTVVP